MLELLDGPRLARLAMIVGLLPTMAWAEERTELDLLSLVNPAADVQQGAWSKPAGKLLASKERASKLAIPYLPPSEYDLRLSVRRLERGPVIVGIVVGSKPCYVLLDNAVAGLGDVDGRQPRENETTNTHFRWGGDQPRNIECQVRKQQVTVLVDGEPVVEFQGDPQRFSRPPGWSIPNNQLLFLGANTFRYEVTRLTLHSVDGKPLAAPNPTALRGPAAWLAERREAPLPTRVTVSGAALVRAYPLTALRPKASLPKYLEDSTFVVPLAVGAAEPTTAMGKIRLTVNEDGPMLLAGCWERAPNTAAAWYREVTSTESLRRAAWIPIDTRSLRTPGTGRLAQHTTYCRWCRKGESFELRTRQYHPPIVIVPAAEAHVDIAELTIADDADEFAQRDHFAAKALALLANRKYAELETWTNRMRHEAATLPSGRYQWRDAIRGLSSLGYEADSPQWQATLDLIDAWLAQFPESVSARISKAAVLIELASAARGTEEGQRLLDERYDRAVELLGEAEARDPNDPDLHRLYFRVAVSQGWPRELVDNILSEMLAQRPWSPSAVSQASYYFLPQWYGGAGDIEQLADMLAAATQDTCGDSLYAVVANACSETSGALLPERYQLQWPRIERGFRDWLKRYPKGQVVLEEFCELACYYKQRDTARELFERIGSRPSMQVWNHPLFCETYRQWAAVDYPTGQQRELIEVTNRPLISLAWLPDREQLATTGYDRRLTLYDLGKPQDSAIDRYRAFDTLVLRLLPTFDGSRIVAQSNDQRIFVCDEDDNWKPVALGEAQQRHSGSVSTIALSAAGTILASGGSDGKLKLWDLASRQYVATWDILPMGGSVHGIAFLADSVSVATGASDGMIRIHSLPSGEVQQQWPAEQKSVRLLAISSDGSRLATAGGDGSIVLWDLAKRTPLVRWNLGTTTCNDLAFSPDGRWLAAACGVFTQARPSSAYLFETQGAYNRHELVGHKGCVWSVAFSTEGNRLATSSLDMSIRLWDLPEASNPMD